MNIAEHIFFAISITTVWIYVWHSSYRVDVLVRARRVITPTLSLPAHPVLVICSSTLLISLSLFYTVSYLYTGTGTDINAGFGIGTLYAHTTFTRLFALLFVGVGALLIVSARKSLSSLTSSEIMFSKNTDPLKHTRVSTGVYAYFKHPMYVGIAIITLSSFLIFPTTVGLYLLLLAYLCLVIKMLVENRS